MTNAKHISLLKSVPGEYYYDLDRHQRAVNPRVKCQQIMQAVDVNMKCMSETSSKHFSVHVHFMLIDLYIIKQLSH